MPNPSNPAYASTLELLRGRLIVSCQADKGDPLDDIDTLTRLASSVLRGGAGGLRAEGTAGVSAFRTITQLPIVGMVKSKDANGEVYITPTFAAAQTVSEAGADIIALDCTQRRLREAEPWPGLIDLLAKIRSEFYVKNPLSPFRRERVFDWFAPDKPGMLAQ